MAENIENNGCLQRDNAEHENYMKNKSVKAMLATLAVTSAVTAQPAMIAHAEEVGNSHGFGSIDV